MSVSVGTLTINLAAETASFTRSMDKASQLSAKTANDIKRSLERIAVAGTAMATAVATGTAALIKGAIDGADKLGKLAQSAGTTAETLSVLNYAAGLSNVGTDQLGVGLVRLSKAAFAAQNGNVQLERIFGRLGVTATDSNGKLKDSGVLMEQLAVKFSGFADGAGKTAIATALFGKSGAALIPFLNQYGAEQEKVNAEAHQFGMVLSQSTVELAGKANDNLQKLQVAFKGLGFAVLGATLPALNNLSDKLIQVAKNADIPDLAKSFGEHVTSAVNLLGSALDFAARHAHALKIAIEGLATLQVAKIAIPVIGDLAGGGFSKVGDGIAKMLISFAGLSRVLPVLARFGAWIKETVAFVGLLATEEGIASAASYVLGGAVAAMGGPIGIAIAAITGLGIALYKFRDATFSLGGTTYELRDVWNASWSLMGKAIHELEGIFVEFFGMIRKDWTDFVSFFSGNIIVNTFKNQFGEAMTWAQGILGKITPQFVIDALNEAKRRREAPSSKDSSSTPAPTRPKTLPQLNTTGLGKPQKDIYEDEKRKLDLAIETQQAYLNVLDGTPEKIQQVAAAEKARAIIVELDNRLTDAGRPKLTALQEATISHKVATEESLKVLNDYGKELVGQQHAADLSIQQTRAMAAANLEGDAATRRVAVDNAILALTYNRTAAELSKMAPEIAKVRAELTAKSNIDLAASTNKETDQLRDQLAERQILTAATFDSLDAQRQADLAAKTFSLNQQITNTDAGAARDALIAQRRAIVNLTSAQWDATDAEAALALLSPLDQYNKEMGGLNHLVSALKMLQGGTISYGEQLQIAAKQQDAFNKATDETVGLMLREGSASDGVKAFFLNMQKEGQTTASILYDTFNSAFNKLSDGLTGVLTAANGWKRREAMNQFAMMFGDVGKQMLDASLKKEMQSGLGSLGKAFGINLTGAKKLDGSSASNALWVRMASTSGSPLDNFGLRQGSSSTISEDRNPLAAITGLKSAFSSIFKRSAAPAQSTDKHGMPLTAIGLNALIPEQSASQQITHPQQSGLGKVLGSIIGMGTSLFGGIGRAFSGGSSSSGDGMPSTMISLDDLIPHASGGPVSPDKAYLVGEQGPEILTGVSGQIVNNTSSRRMLGGSGGDTHTWNIDARGSTDPAQVTAQVNRAMQKAIPQIAAMSVRGLHETRMRGPTTQR